MSIVPQISDAFFIFGITGVAIMIFYPLALALFVSQRLKVSWRYFGFGALIFVLFQLITRVPVVLVAGALVAPALVDNLALQLGWGLLLAFTAGLFESVGRYVGYRWLMGKEEKTWNKGVMYGVGHGGIESMVLVGALAALQIIGLLTLQSMGVDNLGLPPDQRDLVIQQLESVAAQPPWLALLGAWERIWTVIFHVAMSVVVLQVFRRGSMLWLGLAILIHTALDFIGPTLTPLFASSMGWDSTISALFTEGVITVFGLFGLWLIFKFREPPQPEVVHSPAIVAPAAEGEQAA